MMRSAMILSWALSAAAIALTGCGQTGATLLVGDGTVDAPAGVGGETQPVSTAAEPGQLTVHLYTGSETGQLILPNTPVKRYEADLRDSNGHLIATRTFEAPSGEIDATFEGLAAGQYQLYLRAYDSSGQMISGTLTNPVDGGLFSVISGLPTRGQAYVRVPSPPQSSGSATGPTYNLPGRLDVTVTAQDGQWLYYDQAPVQTQYLMPAYGPLSGIGDPIDDGDTLALAPELSATLAGHYAVYSAKREGSSPTYKGLATFVRKEADPQNGNHPTLVMGWPGGSIKFYMDAGGKLVAADGLTGTSGPSLFMVDPEPAGSATLADGAHPGGYAARRYQFLYGNYQTCDLYFGEAAGSGLQVFTLPWGTDEVLHVVRQ